MFCINHHDDLVKYHNYIKKNNKDINEKIKLLNTDTSKVFIKEFIESFNFHDLQKKAMYMYKYIRNNNKIQFKILKNI